MSDLPISISGLQASLRTGAISAVELTQEKISAVKQAQGPLNAFIHVDESGALERANLADQAIAQGDVADLTGIPIAHKEIFCTQGLNTTCGSKMLVDFVAPYDATVTQKLNQAGVVSLGKTNMDEFAMGSSNENSYFGPVANPWDLERVPGGSSGGSAAAVAAGLVPAATATDTGGSIRQPAAFCGVTGIKPTYGRVSRFGMVAFASSLDQGGVIGRSAEDCAWMLKHMAGHDPLDSTSVVKDVPDYPSLLKQDLSALRIGLPEEYWGEGIDSQVASQVEAAIDLLKAQGAQIKPISLPNYDLAVATYYVVAPAEASSNLSRYDGVRFGHRCEHPRDLQDLYRRSRAEGFGDEVKRRILVGTYALSAGYYDAYYLTAQKVRRLIADDFSKAFEQVDVIASPTSPTSAFKLGEKQDDPIAMYMADVNTVAVNLAGLPGLSVPAGFVDGLPVGLQLIGHYFNEAQLLATAHELQQLSDWHLQQAPLGGVHV